MNLLSNSYKFTSKGSVTVSARTIAEHRDSIDVTCAVKDTGIGISQDQVTRLFKPFSQADNSTQREYGGSGLGLSICKALINVLGGTISLESQLGIGTTVSFKVNFAKAPMNAPPSESQDSGRSSDALAKWSSDAKLQPALADSMSHIDLSKIPRNKLRVCIAEDNPINQKIAVSFVAKLGFKSEAFGDGLQTVEALRRASQEKDPFHLVLMDVQMPLLDGYDATRVIRKDEDPVVRSVLIVAMTASAIRGDKEKCIEAGMNNYLAKPVRAAVLKDMLEGYLKKSPNHSPSLEDLRKAASDAIVDGKVEELKKRVSFSRQATSSRDSSDSVGRSRGSELSRQSEDESRDDSTTSESSPHSDSPNPGALPRR